MAKKSNQLPEGFYGVFGPFCDNCIKFNPEVFTAESFTRYRNSLTLSCKNYGICIEAYGCGLRSGKEKSKDEELEEPNELFDRDNCFSEMYSK